MSPVFQSTVAPPSSGSYQLIDLCRHFRQLSHDLELLLLEHQGKEKGVVSVMSASCCRLTKNGQFPGREMARKPAFFVRRPVDEMYFFAPREMGARIAKLR
jgi:hypothetical protein